MKLGQANGALLQCLEHHVLPLLPATALARLSCTCRALHAWLSSQHTTPAWLDAAARQLPAPYLPLAPQLSLAEVTALLQREAAIQKQLSLGKCAAVVQVAGIIGTVLASSNEYCVCYEISSKNPRIRELVLCSLDTGLMLGRCESRSVFDRVQFQGECLHVIQSDDHKHGVEVATLALPSMQEVRHLTLAAPTALHEGHDFDLSPDGQYAWVVWAIDRNMTFAVYHVLSGRLIASLPHCVLISWHPIKPVMAVWDTNQGNEQLLVWNCMTDQEMYTIQGSFTQLKGSHTWSLDGHWIACCVPIDDISIGTGYVQILQAANGEPQVRSRVGHSSSLYIRFSPDNSKAIVNNSELGWEVLDIINASVLHSLKVEQDVLGFCPRSNMYATASADATVYMHVATSGQCCATLDLSLLVTNAHAVNTIDFTYRAFDPYPVHGSFFSAFGDRIVVSLGTTVKSLSERLYLVMIV